ISGEGTVVWNREPDPNRTGVAPGMGVRFDKLSPQSQPILDKILGEKQKRGDAHLESRFDAGVRASAMASGMVTTKVQIPASQLNEFAGDSKVQTPLPAPAPALSETKDEFAAESTRVMQDALVQQLTNQTRSTPPREPGGNFDSEPTRRATFD